MDTRRSRKINLIPQELAVPSRTVKLVSGLTKLTTVVFISIIVVVFVFGGLIYYFSNENNILIQKTESLKDKIVSLSASEQKMVLAKDRVAKISIVEKEKNIENEVSRFKSFSNFVFASPDTNLSEANLTTKGSEVSLVVKDSPSLSSFVTTLQNLKEYQNIIISSLSFNPNLGFLLTITLENI